MRTDGNFARSLVPVLVGTCAGLARRSLSEGGFESGRPDHF
jgi:hypothetical protein